MINGVSSLFLMSILLFVNTACNRSIEKVQLEFAEIESPAFVQLPVIPWTAEHDRSWTNEAALLSISSDSIKLSATAWAAVSPENILFKVVVNEPHHANNETGISTYNGSSIQIGIDVRGDGVGDLPRDAVYVGPDDGTIGPWCQ